MESVKKIGGGEGAGEKCIKKKRAAHREVND